MELRLERVHNGPTFTLGDFYIGGKLFCQTIEDTERVLHRKEDKIYGITAIPRGRYKVILTWSPKFKRVLPLLLDVPYFEGVRIHSGNTEKDSLGCIIVGERRRPYEGYVYNSRATEERLMKVLSSVPKDEEIWLTVC